MGSALEAVLALKQQQAAQQQQQSDNLTQGLQMLQNAKQQAIQNKMADLQYKAGLAEKGLVPDQSTPSGFRFDSSTMNPIQNILMGTKLQADAKTAGNKQIYDLAGRMLGGVVPGSNAQSQIPQSSSIMSGSPIAQVIGGGNSSVAAPGEMTPTGQTSSTDPITGLTIGTTTMTNIPAKVSETIATDMGKAQADAAIGVGRDNAQLQMVSQGIKNMNEIHKELSDKGYAGNTAANFLINNYNHIPNKDLQNKLVPPDVQNLAGKFISARNETLVKVQPILSQQFGAQGSSRIMDSLINLSKGEFGDLSTPHSQFEGQAAGSIGSLFRIKLASDKYLEELKKSGSTINDIPKTPKGEQQVIDGIYANMGDLTPKQNDQLKAITDNVLGKNVSTQKSEILSFANEADAAKAGLAEGTPIIINGRKGKWSNK